MPYTHHKLVLEVFRDGEKIDHQSIRINDKLGKANMAREDIQIRSTIINIWEEAYFYYPTAKLEISDELKLYIWNTSQLPMKIKSLSISGCAKIVGE